MERSNFSLRLLPSLLKAAQRVAEKEGCSVNQLINVALAQKLAVLDRDYWEERKREAPEKGAESPFKRVRSSEPPREGDELPASMRRKAPKALGVGRNPSE